MKRKSSSPKPSSAEGAEAMKRTVYDLFPKPVHLARPVTLHPLPAEECSQLRLKKQSNFISQWIEIA
jgi:hypothetical protein